jgi:hypothetical protein
VADPARAIVDVVQGVTKKWAKQRRAEERAQRQAINRRYAFTARRTTVKDAAYAIMPEAYRRASADGRYPANARQVMYAARPHIQQLTGEPLNDAYFTQRLLPDYLAETGVGWDVVFDARGHFAEPHTKVRVPLGTLEVREYLGTAERHAQVEHPRLASIGARFPTHGPANRFGAVLFIEKEGFDQLLRAARIAERFDLAIMSTKGMSVTASRQLVERLEVPLLVLHDFDQAGFAIIGTLRRSTRRFHFRGTHQVIDLGLTLADITHYGLEAERQKRTHSEWTLRTNGATADDIAFLAQHQRVELNMLASDEFVELVERKLIANGVAKVIPDPDVLRLAYRRAYEVALLNRALADAARAAHARALALDAGAIDTRTSVVRTRLERDPPATWDDVVAALAEAALEDEPAERP